jgi:hypothetical protein
MSVLRNQRWFNWNSSIPFQTCSREYNSRPSGLQGFAFFRAAGLYLRRRIRDSARLPARGIPPQSGHST